MSGTDELYPPTQYGWGWILLVLAVLVVGILVVWLVLALTKPRRTLPGTTAQPPIAPPAGEILMALRQEYLTSIAEVENAYRSGRMDPKRANLELSRIVRAFVNEYSGLEAPVMSLDDLVAAGVSPALIDALRRHYYPSIFRGGPIIDPVAGSEAARKVVTTWR